ncbi:MAG: hypothetical protein IJ837_02345 [Clostridia bacterium]|nr:hypothetical protein [Clostridia bacterium]
MAENKNEEQKNKISSIKAPVLKRRKITEAERTNELPKFNFDDYTNVSYEDQTKLFNGIKEMFAELRENSKFMEEQAFNQKYISYFVELLDMAVTGNVTAMDYLCYVYKKGIDGILPSNLTLAHKWGMLAIANGSKLAVDRLRMFITPVFEYVDDTNIDIEYMADRYDVQEEDIAYFIAQMFAGLYNPRMGISLLEMSRQEPAVVDTNFTRFMNEATKVRSQVLPDLMKYLK